MTRYSVYVDHTTNASYKVAAQVLGSELGLSHHTVLNCMARQITDFHGLTFVYTNVKGTK